MRARSDGTPDTLHVAVQKLLTKWESTLASKRPAWLVDEIANLKASFDHAAASQAAKVNRDAVGRKLDDRRDQIADLLKAGKKSAEIAQETKASAGLIQTVRDELREKGEWPPPKSE